MEARNQVGVIEFPWILEYPYDTEGHLNRLLNLGSRGRVVGWGIWKEMNLALRDIGPSGAEVLSQELPLHWQGFTIRQSGKVRWSIEKGGRRVVIWDLWNWVKRPPQQGETARALYLAIKSAGKKFGVNPRGYYGNGNLASPILRVQKVECPDLEEIAPPIASAFYGGRIQSIRIGKHIGPIYEYDLNSAYAWGLSQLPEITGMNREPPMSEWCLVDTKWNIPRERHPIYPFPVRAAGGKVEYPRQGRGWQWGHLYREARKHWPRHVACMGFVNLECSERRPFSFVHDLYAARQSMTNPLEKAVAKWTLSALWGKLCQRPHGRHERQSFRSLAWAGMATSLVNAELLRAAMSQPQTVWSFGVDSLICDGVGCYCPTGTGLGQWKRSRYEAIEAYQPGFWRCLRSDGTWKEKSRGVPEGAFDWEEAAKEWKKYGSYGRVPVQWREFVGLGSAAEGSEWGSSKSLEFVVLLRPGGLKGLADLQRAGAGGTRTWEPPDRIEETEEFGQGYGMDHSANSEQEAI